MSHLSRQNATAFLNLFLGEEKSSTDFNNSYYLKHFNRFLESLLLIPEIKNGTALEIGMTHLFQKALPTLFGYTQNYGTLFYPDSPTKISKLSLTHDSQTLVSTLFSLNIETELFPLPEESIDTILFFEVIEHMDIDPQFPLIEFNRILKKGGTLCLSTPNSCSARNLLKIARGYRPHFFMQYEKSRSPFRHNFEHDVHSLSSLLHSSGFSIEYIQTLDVFEDTLPEALTFIEKSGSFPNHRGDCIFIRATKKDSVIHRWPSDLYV